MRIEFSNLRVTAKGNGFIADTNDGKIWFPLADAAGKVDGADAGIAVVEGLTPSDDGNILFVRNPERLAFRGAARRVVEGGVAKTVRGWREVSLPVVVDDPAVTIDLSRIQSLVDRAVSLGAKRVSFKFRDQNNEPIKIHLGRSGKSEGKLVLSDGGPFGASKFYGTAERGQWRPTRATPETVKRAVAAFNEDPAAAAKLSGQLTGECCFCSRVLETRESVSAGYGPVCAERFGLPWGEVLPESGIEHVREQLSA